MNFQELSIQPISHQETLNPVLWADNTLQPEVRHKLLQIAKHFVEYLKSPNIQLTDITISGSNAGYNYSQYSDIDLHLVANIQPEQEELFTAKKNNYNFAHNIKVNGIDVELYVQSSTEQHHSAGVYSVLRNAWVREPSNTPPSVSAYDIKSKARSYAGQINQALRSGNLSKSQAAMAEISRLRKAGLATGGENSVENLAFKLLRARGQIDKLRKYIDKLQSAELSLGENNED